VRTIEILELHSSNVGTGPANIFGGKNTLKKIGSSPP
jgi:hypothetical protein